MPRVAALQDDRAQGIAMMQEGITGWERMVAVWGKAIDQASSSEPMSAVLSPVWAAVWAA